MECEQLNAHNARVQEWRDALAKAAREGDIEEAIDNLYAAVIGGDTAAIQVCLERSGRYGENFD